MPRSGSKFVVARVAVARVAVARVLLLALSGLVLAACAGTSVLHGSPPKVPKPKTVAGTDYLAELSQAQESLARAESLIPRGARTPAALSRSIVLLAKAVRGLEANLRRIRPPKPVAQLHFRLIAIVDIYSRQLDGAARQARTAFGELPAAEALSNATATASNAFTATFSQIATQLAK